MSTADLGIPTIPAGTAGVPALPEDATPQNR